MLKLTYDTNSLGQTDELFYLTKYPFLINQHTRLSRRQTSFSGTNSASSPGVFSLSPPFRQQEDVYRAIEWGLTKETSYNDSWRDNAQSRHIRDSRQKKRNMEKRKTLSLTDPTHRMKVGDPFKRQSLFETHGLFRMCVHSYGAAPNM